MACGRNVKGVVISRLTALDATDSYKLCQETESMCADAVA